jgi:hypothetical protein
LFNEDGVTYIPPRKDKLWISVTGAAVLIAAGYLLYRKHQKKIGSALIAGYFKLLTDSIRRFNK